MVHELKEVVGPPIKLPPERHLRGLKVAVETGTADGRFTQQLAMNFGVVHTIELSSISCAIAERALFGFDNIILHHGDSAIVVPKLCEEIEEPCLWYLDAHYCFVRVGKASMGSFPLWDELRAIATRPWADVVYVDDQKNFGNYRPDLEEDENIWVDVTEQNILKVFGDRVAWHTNDPCGGMCISLKRRQDVDDET